MDILEEIVAHKREEIDERKRYVPIQQFIGDLRKQIEEGKPASMREALMSSKTGIIAEFKRKSPSKGWIHKDVKPEDVTPLYESNGASALSILTDTDYFGGYDEYIQQTRRFLSSIRTSSSTSISSSRPVTAVPRLYCSSLRASRKTNAARCNILLMSSALRRY